MTTDRTNQTITLKDGQVRSNPDSCVIPMADTPCTYIFANVRFKTMTICMVALTTIQMGSTK